MYLHAGFIEVGMAERVPLDLTESTAPHDNPS
jgi:hypothetical protein